MTPIICALLGAVGFYFSLGLGNEWWLAWFAPIPILWHAFGERRAWIALLASWSAFAVGATSWLRAYAGVLPNAVLAQVATMPRLLAVPAWDFGADAWAHARVAVLRSVENGVPMARSARRGMLTLNDRFGRLTAKARTEEGFTILVGDLPLDGPGGTTIYDRLGDVFGWFCLALGSALVGASVLRRQSAAPRTLVG